MYEYAQTMEKSGEQKNTVAINSGNNCYLIATRALKDQSRDGLPNYHSIFPR